MGKYVCPQGSWFDGPQAHLALLLLWLFYFLLLVFIVFFFFFALLDFIKAAYTGRKEDVSLWGLWSARCGSLPPERSRSSRFTAAHFPPLWLEGLQGPRGSREAYNICKKVQSYHGETEAQKTSFGHTVVSKTFPMRLPEAASPQCGDFTHNSRPSNIFISQTIQVLSW